MRAVGWSPSRVCVCRLFAGADFHDYGSRGSRGSKAGNREAIEEAAALNAATLVLVPGGLPPGDRDLEGARDRASRAIGGSFPTPTSWASTLASSR